MEDGVSDVTHVQMETGHEDAHGLRPLAVQQLGHLWTNNEMTTHSVSVQLTLKALFNNVSTVKNLSCMSLHAISVFDKRCKN